MKFRDLADMVMPEVPGCPMFQIEKAAREAAIQLFSRADLYRAEPEVITVTGSDYQLSAPVGAEPCRVMEITHNGQALKKVASEQDIYAMLDRGTPAKPTHYYQRDNDTVIFAPAPDAPYQLRLFLSLKPSSTATAIPDGIGKEHRKLLAMGTKAELMLMGNQPWTNPQLGVANKQMFDRGVSNAIRRVTLGNNGAPLTVKKRDFI